MNYHQNLFILIALVISSCAEKPSSSSKKTSVNSDNFLVQAVTFENDFKNTNINYRYLHASQTHDYSNNWDFDGDGKNDEIKFIGMDGAHQYFYLSIKLSTEKETRTYPWIASDMPVLEDFKKLPDNSMAHVQQEFVVHDFNADGLPDIFVNSETYNRGDSLNLNKYGLTKGRVVLSYDTTKIDFMISESLINPEITIR